MTSPPTQHGLLFVVAGGAGFMGSHMVDFLLRTYPDCQVTCIDKLTYATKFLTANLQNAMKAQNFRFVQLDVAESSLELHSVVAEALAAAPFSAVLNFAAESCVDLSFADPLHFTRNNILATQNLLECAREFLRANPLRQLSFAFLHISTDEVYGEQGAAEKVDEQARLHPSNPYAATKAACDLIIGSYVMSFQLPVTLVRSNNVYGLRQYPEKLVSVALEALKHASPQKGLPEAERIPIHGTGRNTRRYIHVFDFVKGVDILLQRCWHGEATAGEIYNVGTDDEVDNISMVKSICSNYMRIKHGVEDVDYDRLIRFTDDRNYNDARYATDFSKLESLGWKQEVDLDRGLTELITNDY